MRSAEASGGEAEGFGGSHTAGPERFPLVELLRSVAPASYAVAATALLAATLFLVTDLTRSAGDAADRAQLVTRLAAVDTAFTAPAASDTIGPVATRAAVAYGLALLLIALSFRRRAPAAGNLAGLVDAIREEQRVLARRYHEEKLRAEAASRSKTSFLAHLSHDVRTPLNHIIGFAELMRHQTYGPLGDARYVGYVESIASSGERLLGFFASILDLAELESGRRLLDMRELGADELLGTVAQRFAAQAQGARVSLVVGAPCGARLLGDRFSLERTLANLVDNALRFTPAGGRVTLAAYAADDGVVLEVTDTGIGMAPERLAAISQPFAFGDATLTRSHAGAGFGLAVARTIVELSGGHLAIDSRPGLGTTVAVSLPRRGGAIGLDAAA